MEHRDQWKNCSINHLGRKNEDRGSYNMLDVSYIST